ncbi:hypothetical protein [Campylobacter sp.]|uniref:hypothetical protein n=1 Tax=Campylobacter sp. TaxID=205 RepID=UPI0026DD3167|nr:hypothetical protein [Campylobacter sp.]MDO4674930.1 hypothetical protein [Campylobacter sp.]
MKKIWLFVVVLFLSACAVKNPKTQNPPTQTMRILLSSPAIKINDMGFLRHEGGGLILQIYKLGKPLLALSVRDKICLNGACYAKRIFNEKFFNHAHYDDFLSDILKARPLYAGKNLQKSPCGSTQVLEAKNYAIVYELCGENVRFWDKISRVRLQLTRQK